MQSYHSPRNYHHGMHIPYKAPLPNLHLFRLLHHNKNSDSDNTTLKIILNDGKALQKTCKASASYSSQLSIIFQRCTFWSRRMNKRLSSKKYSKIENTSMVPHINFFHYQHLLRIRIQLTALLLSFNKKVTRLKSMSLNNWAVYRPTRPFLCPSFKHAFSCNKSWMQVGCSYYHPYEVLLLSL